MSIERKAISALKWAAASKLVVQITSWTGTLVVVRLLTPDDYGLMAKVSAVCTIAAAVAELGVGAAIVRATDISDEDLRKIFGVSLVLALCVTAAVFGGAPLIAKLFGEPRLMWPVACASLQIMVTAAASIPNALWTRDLSFQKLAKMEMAAGTAGILVTLALALLGAGVWALVLGLLFGAITRSSALLIFGRRVWPLFSLRGIGEHLKFGLTLVANRVSYFILIQSDVLIGSAFLSTMEIGRYAVALQLANLPMAKVMGTVNQITLPTVARQQHEPARMRQSVLKAIGLMSLVAFPALWGISAIAPELVRVLLGTKWLESVPALTILPLVVPIRMVCSLLFTTSLALGNRSLDLRNTIVNFILIPTGFFIGAHWGMIGLCLAWPISVPLAYAFSVPAVVRFIGFRRRELLVECGAPAIAAVAMYAAVATLRWTLADQAPVVSLLALTATGAAVYFTVIGAISRRHLISAYGFAKSMFVGGPSKGRVIAT